MLQKIPEAVIPTRNWVLLQQKSKNTDIDTGTKQSRDSWWSKSWKNSEEIDTRS